MSETELKQTARRWFDAINSGDIHTLDQVVAYDVVDHSGLSDTHGFGGDGHKKLAQQLLSNFSGWQSRIDNMQVDGDLVIIDHSGRATLPSANQSLLGAGVPSNSDLGKVDFKVRSCVRIKDGKIVEHWALEGPFGQKTASGAPGAPASSVAWSSAPSSPGAGPTSAPAGTPTSAPIGTTDENKLLLQRYVKNVIDGQNPALADYYFAPNFFNHDRAPGEQPGLEGVKQFIGSIFAAFTGFQTTIEEQIAEDDLVVGRWSQSFTNTGPYLSFPASGKTIHIGGITITRVRDGKIVEEWEARDAVGLLVQMGVIPPLGPLQGSAASAGQRSENEALVSRFFYEAWNAGNKNLVDDVVAPSFANHNLLVNQPDGPQGLKDWIGAWHTGFPDMNIAVDLLISEGSKVATRWNLNGTHRGTFLGLNPTGKYVSIPGITIFRIEGGKIIEGWGFWEQAGMLAQLGVVQFPQWTQPQTPGGQSAGAGQPPTPGAPSAGAGQPPTPSWPPGS